MINDPLQKIEALYFRMQKLLTELLDCVESERDNLVRSDLENLMLSVKNEQKILIAIQNTAGKIKKIRKTACPKRAFPVRGRQRLEELSARVAELKQQVMTKERKNISYIRDALCFSDDLILMFITGGGDVDCYGPIKRGPKGRSNLMLNKEV